MSALDPLPRPQWTRAILLATVTGALVTATAYLTAWLQFRNHISHYAEQGTTYYTLRNLSTEIEQYRERRGKLPGSLDDLQTSTRSTDGWQRPLEYRQEGDTYVLSSLGADGQPGGDGLDADLYADGTDRERARPTLWQFTTRMNTTVIRVVSLLAGGCAFAVCLLYAANPTEPRSLRGVLLTGAVTAFFAIETALFISLVHLPSGH